MGAVLGIVGSVLMTKAVCWMTPAKTMVIRSIQVIISYIIQVEFFGTLPHTSDYFGALLIMTAVFTIGAEEKMMKTFSFFIIQSTVLENVIFDTEGDSDNKS